MQWFSFCLFLLSQSVSHSFIYIWRSLFVSPPPPSLSPSLSFSLLWGLLSKIFRILFIMRCSLSGYQFWSKEFIELASHSHLKCGVGLSQSVRGFLTHVFMHGKLKLKFKANIAASKNPPNFCMKIAQNLFTTRFHT